MRPSGQLMIMDICIIVINGSYEEMNGVQKETRHCLCNKSAMFTCNKAKMDEETNKVYNKLLLI